MRIIDKAIIMIKPKAKKTEKLRKWIWLYKRFKIMILNLWTKMGHRSYIKIHM